MAELLLVNPRRRRRHKAAKSRKRRRSVRRFKVARRRHYARAVRRHRRKHRRAIAVVARSNPIRRGRKRRRFSLRRYSSNPISSPMGFIKNALVPSAIGAGGALGVDVLIGFATPYLPAMLTGPTIRPVVRLAGAVALGMIASKVAGRKIGEQVAAGAITVTVYDFMKGIVKSAVPSLPLSGNDYPYMGFYQPGYPAGSSEMGEYMDGVGEYVEG